MIGCHGRAAGVQSWAKCRRTLLTQGRRRGIEGMSFERRTPYAKKDRVRRGIQPRRMPIASLFGVQSPQTEGAP